MFLIIGFDDVDFWLLELTMLWLLIIEFGKPTAISLIAEKPNVVVESNNNLSQKSNTFAIFVVLDR